MIESAAAFSTPADTPTNAPLEPRLTQGDTSPPIVFGDYDLEREIAHGGMGVVYRARQRSLGRTVAVKLLLLGRHASRESIQRFRREAQSAAALRHPNIIAIYEVGECEGQQFFSMEYVEGPNLAELTRPGPLDPREAAIHTRTIADAVHFAHTQGVLHRDIKPSNILLDALGELRITDFGLARPLDGSSDLTETGRVLGTPHYLAPEAAAGRVNEVGPASDVYAIGAVLYEMLTGRPPFLAPSIPETLLRIRDAEPVAPRRLNPTIPPDLETICLKCLEKAPPARYETALALAADLGRWLRHEPITARPVSGAERVAKWMRRNPRLAGLLALSGLAATALIATLAIANVRIRAANARTASEADANRRGLVRLHVQTGNHRVEDGDALAALAWFVEALALDRGHPVEEDIHRRRIGAALRGAPVLEQLWFHDALVNDVVYSPDSIRVAVLGPKGELRMWNARTGTSVPAPAGPTDQLLFSPKGRQFMTLARRAGTRFWNAVDASRVAVLPTLKLGGQAAYRPDGRHLAVSTSRGIQLLDLNTGLALGPPRRLPPPVLTLESPAASPWLIAGAGLQRLWRLYPDDPLVPPHRIDLDRPVTHWALRVDGRRLAGVTGGNRVRQWDLTTGKPIEPDLVHTSTIYSVEYSHDGTRIATAEWAGTAQVWDASTGRRIGQPLVHHGGVRQARFSPDSQEIATASWDTTARLWDAHTGQPSAPILRHAGFVTSLAFSPDGSRLLTGSQDTAVRQWRLSSRAATRLTLSHGGATVYRTRYDPQGRWIVTAGDDGTARVWNRDTGEPRLVLHHAGPVLDAWFSPDGTLILTASSDGTARLWNADNGEPVGREFLQGDRVVTARFSPDGQRFFTLGGTVLRVWDTATGEAVAKPLDRGSPAESAAFHPDGTRLVSGHADGFAQIWDLKTGQPAGPPLAVGGPVRSIQFSPNGARVLTAWTDDSQLPSAATLWDPVTGQPVAKPMVHFDGLYSAEFSPDGRRIVTCGEDNTARVWDGITGEPVTPPLRHRAYVYKAAFSPDGRLVATASRDGTARVWESETGEAVTPPLIHPGRAGWIDWSPDGREVATAWNEGGAGQVFDVSPHPEPLERLRAMAELLGSHRLHPVAGATPLTALEMRQRWEALHGEPSPGWTAHPSHPSP